MLTLKDKWTRGNVSDIYTEVAYFQHLLRTSINFRYSSSLPPKILSIPPYMPTQIVRPTEKNKLNVKYFKEGKVIPVTGREGP
jgi:hypothetical protein